MSAITFRDLTDEQRMLSESVQRYVRERYDFAKRTQIIEAATDSDPEIWRSFSEQGWLGLPFAEDFGGSAGSMTDVLILMQGFGRGLVVEPYLSTVVLAGMTLAAIGNNEQKSRLVPKLVAGELRMALAFAEPDSEYDTCSVATSARKDANGFRLTGHKSVVLGAPSADFLIVSARTEGAQRDRAGLSLFLLNAKRPGIALRSYATIDGRRAAEVTFDNVRIEPEDILGPLGQGADVLDEAIQRGAIAVIGEAIGAMQGALDTTIGYLNIREQFGKPLAAYQALRHRITDMFILKEEASALGLLAAQAFDNSTGLDRAEAIAAAKAYTGEEGRKVGEEAVQLHGAIAITDEYVVGHYLKRLVAIDRLFGNVDYHLDLFQKIGQPFRETSAGSEARAP